MEKTWAIREQEIREEIAQEIEDAIDAAIPPIDDAEYAAYNSLIWAAKTARGK
jgi:hypothetical protein